MRRIIAVLPDDLVIVDPFLGSGTTAVACIKEKRNFIGFELNADYFKEAQNRIKAEQKQLTFEF
jgi:DNA modification methylase